MVQYRTDWRVNDMQTFDNEFFEEYKHLDKLCSEIYDCRNGISRYISEMERLEGDGARRVTGWDYDYRMLKHIRYVRNLIAHDSEVYQISTPDDLFFVREYYRRIMSGDDALTVLRKSSVPQRTPKKTTVSAAVVAPQTFSVRQTEDRFFASPRKPSLQPQGGKHRWTVIVCLIALILLVMLTVYLCGHLCA